MTAIYKFSYADSDSDSGPVLTPIEAAENRSWEYATKDPVACASLAEKLGASCSRGRAITYAEFSRGTAFILPGVNDGNRYVMDIREGKYISESDQYILDDFLCFLSLQSAKGAGILASANVYDPKERNGVPRGFIATARLLGYRKDSFYAQISGRMLSQHEEMEQMAYWNKEQQKVYAWFKRHASGGTEGQSNASV